jgi:hypothetical protein
MQSYDLVKKEWLVSPAARTVYRAAALISLTLLPVLIAIPRFYPAPPFLRSWLLVSILGTALNGAAMECFLLRYDNKSGLKQVFWFLAMFIAPFGPALYTFLVYSRSGVLKQACAERTDRVSGNLS